MDIRSFESRTVLEIFDRPEAETDVILNLVELGLAIESIFLTNGIREAVHTPFQIIIRSGGSHAGKFLRIIQTPAAVVIREIVYC